MAWSTPKTFVAGDTLTHTDLNQQLYHNMRETMVAKATGPGQLFHSLGNNDVTPVDVHTVYDTGVYSTSSTTYQTVPGTSIDVPIVKRAMVVWGGDIDIDSGADDASVHLSFEAVGHYGATDNWSLQKGGNSLTNQGLPFTSVMVMHIGGMAGSTVTFRLKLRSSNGDSVSVSRPRLTILPL